MNRRGYLIGIWVVMLCVFSCKDETEEYKYTIRGKISVVDNCGPSREIIGRDSLSKSVAIRYSIRNADSNMLQGSTEVQLNDTGSAFYSITVKSPKKLNPGATWGIPMVKIDCPKFRCFLDSIPNCTARPIRDKGMVAIPIAKDTVINDLEFECYCAP